MRALSTLVVVMLFLSNVAAAVDDPNMVVTDGTNRNSPIKVVEVNLANTSRGQNLEWVTSAPGVTTFLTVVIQNSSPDQDLQDVSLYAELQTQDGQEANTFTRQIGTLKAGASYTFDTGGFFIYQFAGANLEPGVEVTHRKTAEDSRAWMR